MCGTERAEPCPPQSHCRHWVWPFFLHSACQMMRVKWAPFDESGSKSASGISCWIWMKYLPEHKYTTCTLAANRFNGKTEVTLQSMMASWCSVSAQSSIKIDHWSLVDGETSVIFLPEVEEHFMRIADIQLKSWASLPNDVTPKGETQTSSSNFWTVGEVNQESVTQVYRYVAVSYCCG